MTKNRLFRIAAIAIALMLPVFLSGCLSRDMRLANKGFSQIENGQLVDAEGALTEAVQANPNNAFAALNLGTVYQRTGRFEQARALFEKVIALDAQEKPGKRSKFVEPTKNLREIAEDNLRLLPPKK
jgi:Flp pilus assembly protein TadD